MVFIVVVILQAPYVFFFNVLKAFLSGGQIMLFPTPPFVFQPHCACIQKNLDWFISIVPFINTWQFKSTNNRKENIKNNGTINPILILLQNLPKEGGNKNASFVISNMHFSNLLF